MCKRACRSCMFTIMWLTSALSGYFLYFCTLFPLMFIRPKLYRLFTDCVLTFWQFHITTLVYMGLHFPMDVSGDSIRIDETVVLISNHRTRVDWNFLWPAVWYATIPDSAEKFRLSTKFMLKNSIKLVPGLGWLMQLSSYLFIHRNWEKDKQIINDYVAHVTKTNYKHIMIMFPEGTDFTAQTKAISDRYAEANQLQKYEHVLHPRTTGFAYMVCEMIKNRCIDAVYDVTIIYPENYPQNEFELFVTSGVPSSALVHFKRYPVKDLPQTMEGLVQFLQDRWREKEEAISTYRNIGIFYPNDERYTRFDPNVAILIIGSWTSITTFTMKYAMLGQWFRFIVFYETLVLIATYFLPSKWQTYDLIACGKLKRQILGSITIAPYIDMFLYIVKGTSFTFANYIGIIGSCIVGSYLICSIYEWFLNHYEYHKRHHVAGQGN